MYVICFYWEGERWQETQKIEGAFADHLKKVGTASRELVSVYVNNLYKGVQRFANQPFKFVCFTNKDIPNLDADIETRHLPMYTSKGVLPRLYMFSREAGLFGHQVLCLDLDVVVVGSLTSVMDYRGPFCGRTAYSPMKKADLKSKPVDGDIMSFPACEETEQRFWTPFIKDVNAAEQFTGGRERFWIQSIVDGWGDRWEDPGIAPGQIVSYKLHRVRNWDEIPKPVSIISCHGKPRPHQINATWRREYWPYEN